MDPLQIWIQREFHVDLFATFAFGVDAPSM